MAELRHTPLLSRRAYHKRLARSIATGGLIVAVALFVGMLGYRYLEAMNWIDAFASAAMILSGMGPLAPLNTTAGKLFAGFYALFSGLAFVGVIGVVFAPVVHRSLHRFHLETEARTAADKSKK